MQHILSLSYGKDSMACLEAIKRLGWPLDRVIAMDVWATKDIPADYPEVADFKKHADHEIKKRYGIKVEHACKLKSDGSGEKLTFEDKFYTVSKGSGKMYGFPRNKYNYCKELKVGCFKDYLGGLGSETYIGFAADEKERAKKIKKETGTFKFPLIEIGWTESDCMEWCKENELLSPTYSFSFRDGCWFCPYQTIDQLRILRNRYPKLWGKLLEWNANWDGYFSGGHTVQEYDRRFEMEEKGLVPADRTFRWKMLEDYFA